MTIDHPPDDVLTKRFHEYYSQVIPSGFKIHHLPDKIESFALSHAVSSEIVDSNGKAAFEKQDR